MCVKKSNRSRNNCTVIPSLHAFNKQTKKGRQKQIQYHGMYGKTAKIKMFINYKHKTYALAQTFGAGG